MVKRIYYHAELLANSLPMLSYVRDSLYFINFKDEYRSLKKDSLYNDAISRLPSDIFLVYYIYAYWYNRYYIVGQDVFADPETRFIAYNWINPGHVQRVSLNVVLAS